MAELALIDTDILVDTARGTAESIGFLREMERRATLAISVVTEMELIVGCRNKAEIADLERFLHRFRVLHIDQEASRMAARLLFEYRLSHGLLIADAFIAATAITQGCPLASRNIRHYRFIAGLQLLPAAS